MPRMISFRTLEIEKIEPGNAHSLSTVTLRVPFVDLETKGEGAVRLSIALRIQDNWDIGLIRKQAIDVAQAVASRLPNELGFGTSIFPEDT